MAVSKKIQQAVKDTIDFGMLKGLPEFMLYIVYAKARKLPQNGWAIIGAGSKKEAKEIALTKGWLETAIVFKVLTFSEYCESFHMTKEQSETEYNRIKNINKLPKKVGEWYELEWGI